MIESLFSVLGVPKVEARLYVALADTGKAPASILARTLQLPRSTVYTALESLVMRGLVNREDTAEVALYSANPTDSVKAMIESERVELHRKLSDKDRAVTELVPLLQARFKGTNFSVPELEFFEGKAGIEAMLYRYERTWQESVAKYDFTWWGYQDHHFVENYRKWLERYWASMKEEEKICLLSNESKTESQLKSRVRRRSVKLFTPDNQFSSTIWVLGDYVVTIMTRQQPHYAFQLKDAVFAANQRLVFQMLWNAIK